jgi:2-methylcitrate dehydratase PrpD
VTTPYTETGLEAVVFKYHSACLGTHAVIECGLQLHADGVAPADIDRVTLLVHETAPKAAAIVRPNSGREGRFSLQFAFAVGVSVGPAGVDVFTDERAADRDLLALVDRTVVEIDPTSAPAGLRGTARLTDRRGTAREVRAVVGLPADRAELADQERRLVAKATSTVTPTLGPSYAEELVGACLASEHLDDVTAIAAILRAAG